MFPLSALPLKNALALAMSAVLCAAAAAVDVPKPEFFGIYALKSDGALVPLPAAVQYHGTSVVTAGNAVAVMEQAKKNWVYIPKAAFPAFKPGEVKGFVVYSDDIKPGTVKIDNLVPIPDFLAGGAGMVENKGPAKNDSTDFYINTEWGNGNVQFDIKRLDTGMYYFQMKGGVPINASVFAPFAESNDEKSRKPTAIRCVNTVSQWFPFVVQP